MEWYWLMALIFGSLVFLMLLGIPVAFAFFLVVIVSATLIWGMENGMEQFVLGLRHALSHYGLLTLPLFILMGEVMFFSGMGVQMLDALDKWIGGIPGRLSLLAVGAGAILASLTGNSMSVTALLGSTLVPEMEKRGYKSEMTLGPILGSGGLSIMIPPSGLAIFIALISMTSIGDTLRAIIIPGILMAVLYATYIIFRAWTRPSLAPSYKVRFPLSEKLRGTLYYVLPLGFIVFAVTGVIILGLATPTEAAATGAFVTFLVAAGYRRLSWKVVKTSIMSSVKITSFIMLIFAPALVFSQILAYTQVTKGLTAWALSFPVPPLMLIILMQLVVLFLGMFMSGSAVALMTLPLFMPIVHLLGFSPVWFITMFILNMEMAQTTPPFGLSLFAIQGAVPPDHYTLGNIYRAALPYLGVDALVMALILAFPAIALWLPSTVR